MEGKRAEALRLLGVLPGSDRRTIGAAYRRLAREHHPDVSKRSDAAERVSPRLLRRSPRLAARIPPPPWSLEQPPIVPGPVRITPVAGDGRLGLGGAPWWI